MKKFFWVSGDIGRYCKGIWKINRQVLQSKTRHFPASAGGPPCQPGGVTAGMPPTAAPGQPVSHFTD